MIVKGTVFGVLVLVAAQAPEFMATGSFLTFEARPAFSENYTRVRIGRLRTEHGRREYWLQMTEIERSSDKVSETLWTDSKRCPAVPQVLESAIGLAPPSVAISGYAVDPQDGVVITMDGVRYTIAADAHYSGTIGSDLSFSSNVGTPLAEWVEGSLEALEACWSEDAPEITNN